MKIIFWGSPLFVIPVLDKLQKEKYEIVGVVTKPDEPQGRKNKLTPTPVKIWAEKHEISVFQPRNLKDKKFEEDLPPADLFLVAAFGKIIPENVLKIPRLGAINIHPSLLPRWRGPSPIQFTILEGDAQTGVSIIQMDELMDHGPMLAQKNLPEDISKIKAPELHDKLFKLGADILPELLRSLNEGEIKPIPQDDAKSTFSKILKKEDGRINWNKPPEYLERMVRAFSSWPGAWTLWPRQTDILRLRIEEAGWDTEEFLEGGPGYVWQKEKRLFVKASSGSLEIKSLTLEGKKPVSAESFLRGYPNLAGATLI